MKIGKLAMAVMVGHLIGTNTALALGLGDIKLESALNEPLSADITLLNARGVSQEDIRVKLASPEDFDRAKVEKLLFMSGFKFRVKIDENGVARVIITSKNIVREPYLNFLIEAQWPSGRVLREYTVLLDLPVFSEVKQAPAPVSSKQQTSPAPQKVQTSAQTAQYNNAGGSWRTQTNETLWGIARKNRPSADTTVNQTMLAIQDLNPDAFVRGNINSLKAGSILRLPTQEQAQAFSRSQATDQVRQQNRAWSSGEASAVPRQSVSGASQDDASTEQSGGRLTLAGAQAETESSSMDSSSGAAVGNRDETTTGSRLLAAKAEQLDQSRLENKEMRDQMAQMEEQLSTLQQLLEVREQQLSTLEQQAVLANQANDVAGSSATQDMTKMASVDLADDTAASSDTRAESTVDVDAAAKADALKKKKATEAKKKARALAQAQAKENEGFMAWVSNNLSLVGGGLLALLVLIFGVLWTRRNKEEDDEELEAIAPAVAVKATKDVESKLDRDAALLTEADASIHNGHFQEAIIPLEDALEESPHRGDIRLKLLEAHAGADGRESFRHQYMMLRAIGSPAELAAAEQLLTGAPSGGAGWLDDLDAEQVDHAEGMPFEQDDDFFDDDMSELDAALDDTNEDDTDDELEAEDDISLDWDADEELSDDDLSLDLDDSNELDTDFDDIEMGEDELGDIFGDDNGDDEDTDLDDGEELDGVATKIELAQAYIDMGDGDGAKDVLQEVLDEGNEEQKAQAQDILSSL
ncbi:MAG: FimV/HubP family polar landmark protein [Pseudomonadales bacterium]